MKKKLRTYKVTEHLDIENIYYVEAKDEDSALDMYGALQPDETEAKDITGTEVELEYPNLCGPCQNGDHHHCELTECDCRE